MCILVRQRRKSRGENDDDDEEIIEDPKIKREIEELSKFKDESGIGKVMYKELEEAKALPMKLLDPWKASRVPNADHEPKFQTRFQSPMFACKYCQNCFLEVVLYPELLCCESDQISITYVCL